MTMKTKPLFADFLSAAVFLSKNLGKNDLVLTIVRHGESISNAKDVFQPPFDKNDHLTRNGKQQAEALGNLLVLLPAKCVLSSDSPRAIETAKISLEADKPKISINKALREFDFGILAGLTHEGLESEFAKKYPVLYQTFCSNIEALEAPSGEKFLDFKKRVKKETEKIISNKKCSSAALFTHYWFAREATRLLAGEKKVFDVPSIGRTGTTIFLIKKRKKPELVLFNSQDHLNFKKLVYTFEEKNNLESLKFVGKKAELQKQLIKKEKIELLWKEGFAYTKDFPSFMVSRAAKKTKKNFSGLSLFAELGLDAIVMLKNNAKTVIGLDISLEQIQMTKANILLNQGNLNNARIIQSDLFKQLPKKIKVDLITANPPQTPNKEIFENGQLKEGGTGPYEPDGDGLGFFRKIFVQAGDFLNKNGLIAFSFQDFLGTEKLTKIAEENNFVVEEITDFPGRSIVYAGGKTDKNLEFIKELTGYNFFKSPDKKDHAQFKSLEETRQNINKGAWYQKKLLIVRKK